MLFIRVSKTTTSTAHFSRKESSFRTWTVGNYRGNSLKNSQHSLALAATKIQQQRKINLRVKLTSLLMAESESVGNWQTSSFSSLMAALFVSFRLRSSVHVESVDSRAIHLIGRSILPSFLNQSNRRTQSSANFLLLPLPVDFFTR